LAQCEPRVSAASSASRSEAFPLRFDDDFGGGGLAVPLVDAKRGHSGSRASRSAAVSAAVVINEAGI
jgi:hypothetical protein